MFLVMFLPHTKYVFLIITKTYAHTLWNLHSRKPQKQKICNIGLGPTAAIASTGFSDMYAGPGRCTTSETSQPTTASIATRPCLISASRMNLTGKIVANPKGSNPMSPTIPSRFLGLVKKGIEADISTLGTTGVGSGSSATSSATSAGGPSAMRRGVAARDCETACCCILNAFCENEGVTNAVAHDAHAVMALTVERTFMFTVLLILALILCAGLGVVTVLSAVTLSVFAEVVCHSSPKKRLEHLNKRTPENDQHRETKNKAKKRKAQRFTSYGTPT